MDRAALLASTLGELARLELWLVAECDCGATPGMLHCRLLTKRYGSRPLVRDVLPRLVCRNCGKRPRSVIATDRADGLGHGGPTASVVVELVG